MSIADIRRSYDWSQLNESDVAVHPMQQLQAWLSQAIELDVLDPTAMTLATVNSIGMPSARIVLLKECTEHGLVFFTNYNSRKGKDIDHSPKASVLFYWSGIERQIRVEGTISKISDAESDKYFDSRPLGSRIGAVVSPQSQKITRTQLEDDFNQAQQKYADNIKRPDFWGGYILKPKYFEFWQGRESRLHDRLIYTLDDNHSWVLGRLAP